MGCADIYESVSIFDGSHDVRQPQRKLPRFGHHAEQRRPALQKFEYCGFGATLTALYKFFQTLISSFGRTPSKTSVLHVSIFTFLSSSSLLPNA